MPSKTSTTVQNTDPWGPSQPYLKNVMENARNLYNRGSTVAPENSTLLQGYKNTLNTANSFDPALSQAGMGQLQSTINGDYMNNNPYLDAMYNQGAKKVSDSVNSNFSAAGRYGSGAHQGVLGETLGNMATDIYGSNYRTERQNQLNAAQLAPSMDSQYQGMLFNNANAITNVGQNMQNYDQLKRMEPYDRLNQYSAIINGYGGLGGNQSTTSPDGNRIGGALGGAASGFALGNAIVPGIGGIIGGGIGGIGGLF